MMATQIVELDLHAAAATIGVRGDVKGLFVLVSSDGRPVRLLRMPRPSNGVLDTRDVLQSIGGVAQQAADRLVGPGIPISIVIPTRERPEDLARCLESLAGVDAGHELVVVDSGPVTGRTAAVAARYGARCLTESLPGANRARNAGLRAATRDIVAFVDDDVVVNRTWVRAIGAPFSDPSVGCVTGLVLPLELETTAQEEFELYCQHRRDLQRHVYSRSVLRASAAGIVGMGANMAFRRNLLLTLGGFDERFGPGTSTRTGDETDMFARVLDAGRLIVYTPDAYVWHRHRRSAREVRSCVFGYGVGLSSMLTKRIVEQRDFAAVITAARWFLGPVVKAARAKIRREWSAPWTVVLAETAGTAFGPFCFGYESWRLRRRTGSG